MTSATGPSVLVTGGARGIGEAIAEDLASKGWSVAINDLDGPALDSVVARLRNLGARVVPVPGDVSDEAVASGIVDAAAGAFGGMYALVNNAGIGGTGTPIQDLSLAVWTRMLQVDLTSVFLMTRACLNHLKRSRGRIVNVSSVSAFVGVAGSAHYCAAKAGVAGLTRALARELAPDGITVNAVAPGVIDTEMARRRGIDHQRAHILLDDIGTPSDVAAAVAYLVSEGGRFVTGQVLHVNGGAYL